MRQSSATWRSISGTKKIANTQTTASKYPSANGRAVMSAQRNSMLRSPRCSAFSRPRRSSPSARSTPITRPAGPTRSAAGSADAPVPQPTSSTCAPAGKASRSTVRRP
jgi:hypothetical protein